MLHQFYWVCSPLSAFLVDLTVVVDDCDMPAWEPVLQAALLEDVERLLHCTKLFLPFESEAQDVVCKSDSPWWSSL